MPSDKGEIVIGVDLDGVCADFYARMREIAAEWREVGLETLTTDVSYGLMEWGIRDEDHYVQLHRFAVTQRDLFETCPPIRGAAATIAIGLLDPLPDRPGRAAKLLGQLVKAASGAVQINHLSPELRRVYPV